MYNPGPNFLSAGLAPLPIMYFVFRWCTFRYFSSGYFTACADKGMKSNQILWPYHDAVINLYPTHSKLLSVHHLLTAVLVLKVLYLLFKGVKQQCIPVF